MGHGCSIVSIQAAEEAERKKMKEEIAQLKQEKEKAEREAAAAKIAAEKERAQEAVARKKKEAAAEEERKAVEGPLKDGSELEVAPPSMHDYADNTLDSKSEEEKAQEAATAGDKTKRNQVSRNYVRVDQVYPTHTTTLIMTSWLDAQLHQYRQEKKPKGRR